MSNSLSGQVEAKLTDPENHAALRFLENGRVRVEQNRLYATVDFNFKKNGLATTVNPTIQFGRVKKLGTQEGTEFAPVSFTRREVTDLHKLIRTVENLTGIVERGGLESLRDQTYLRPSQDYLHVQESALLTRSEKLVEKLERERERERRSGPAASRKG